MRFRFRLETVLDLRRREEDSQRRELAALEARKREVEDALRSRQQEISAGKSALRSQLVGALDPALLRQQASATMAIDRVARHTVLLLAGQAQRIARQRAVLLEATKRRRAIELLRERRWAEWLAEENRRETAFLDEVAVTAGARAKRERAHEGTEERDS